MRLLKYFVNCDDNIIKYINSKYPSARLTIATELSLLLINTTSNNYGEDNIILFGYAVV